MLIKTAKYLFIISFAISAVLVVGTERAFYFLHNGIFNQFESSFLEPIFYWSVAVCLSAFTLLFFNQATYATWYKKVFVWFVPLGLIITFFTNPGISFGGLSRLSTASTLGSLLVITTLLFALVQRFSPKK